MFEVVKSRTFQCVDQTARSGQSVLAQSDPLGDPSQMILPRQPGQDDEDEHRDQGTTQTLCIAPILRVGQGSKQTTTSTRNPLGPRVDMDGKWCVLF
jgi:hypothetical protein